MRCRTSAIAGASSKIVTQPTDAYDGPLRYPATLHAVASYCHEMSPDGASLRTYSPGVPGSHGRECAVGFVCTTRDAITHGGCDAGQVGRGRVAFGLWTKELVRMHTPPHGWELNVSPYGPCHCHTDSQRPMSMDLRGGEQVGYCWHCCGRLDPG